MKTINPDTIKEQINNCYDDYDPQWKWRIGNKEIMSGFKYHMEHTAGVKLDFELEVRHSNKLGYKINSVEIVNESTFTMWLLKWS